MKSEYNKGSTFSFTIESEEKPCHKFTKSHSFTQTNPKDFLNISQAKMPLNPKKKNHSQMSIKFTSESMTIPDESHIRVDGYHLSHTHDVEEDNIITPTNRQLFAPSKFKQSVIMEEEIKDEYNMNLEQTTITPMFSPFQDMDQSRVPLKQMEFGLDFLQKRKPQSKRDCGCATVLIVDDNIFNLSVTESLIQKKYYLKSERVIMSL